MRAWVSINRGTQKYHRHRAQQKVKGSYLLFDPNLKKSQEIFVRRIQTGKQKMTEITREKASCSLIYTYTGRWTFMYIFY